jgi:hypothetical protein
MQKLIGKLIPQNPALCLLIVITFSGLILGLIFKSAGGIWGGGWGNPFPYGFAVFLVMPFFIGILTPLIVGAKNNISLGKSIRLSMLALLGVGATVLIFAIEGVICIVMASPIIVVSTLIGSVIGHGIQKEFHPKEHEIFNGFLIFLLLIPSISYFENGSSEPEATPIVTSIVINAPPEKVWKNVVEFPELAPPNELIFKTGIAYPIRARIEGSGVGAVRYCEFSTGAFVEPITVWDENNLLQFSVEEQPLPMREISPYGELDTPHLHDFFVSKKGQFKLTRLENGSTLLEGTTWYYHKIKPEFYWRLWSEEIIHTIHQRVLNHIKERSEEE